MKSAIVGMGKMGLTHAAMLEVLEPGCVAAVVEADRGAHGTIRSLGLKAPIYPTLPELLERHAIDAAIVCTPTFTHFGLVKLLLERGVAVMIEKPLAENLERCRALAKLAAEKKAVTAVGYSIGFDPLFAEARHLIPSLGGLKRYAAWVEHAEVFGPKKGWLFQKEKSGGGVIINPAPHMLYFLLEAFGVPRTVRAELESPYSACVEDEAKVELAHDGFSGTLRASWSVPNKPVLELALYVEGEKGSHSVDGGEILVEEGGKVRRVDRADLPEGEVFELSPQARAANYFREDRDFLEHARKKTEPANSIGATLKVDALIDAIYRSGASGQAVPWA